MQVEVKIVEEETSKSVSDTAEGEMDERIREDSTWKNVENDTPRIRSSSSSSSSKSKCDDSDKIVESDASTEPSSSRRPVETTPSAGGSKNLDTATKDAAATVRRVLFVVVCVRA